MWKGAIACTSARPSSQSPLVRTCPLEGEPVQFDSVTAASPWLSPSASR